MLDTVEAMWSLYVKQGSRMTPRSLATVAGVISFPNKVRRKSSTLLTIAVLPKIINIVLLGLIRRWFLKVQLLILHKSLFNGLRFANGLNSISLGLSLVGNRKRRWKEDKISSLLVLVALAQVWFNWQISYRVQLYNVHIRHFYQLLMT